jgi:hypothetical protein
MDTNVKFTDPFYNSDEFTIDGQYKEFDSQGEDKKESSFESSCAPGLVFNPLSQKCERSSIVSVPVELTAPSTPQTSSGGGVNWGNVANNAPQILGAIGNIIGAVQGGGGTGSGTGVESVCGKPPLIVITGQKKREYEQCAANYAQQQAAIAQANAGRGQGQREGEGMSTLTKVLIGVGILIFLIIIVVLIVVLSRKKQESK